MSATDQPYSEKALESVRRAARITNPANLTAMLDAAHDRERLGLEASVHAASFLDEIVTKLWEWDGIPEADRRKAVAFLLREFASEAIGATDDQ